MSFYGSASHDLYASYILGLEPFHPYLTIWSIGGEWCSISRCHPWHGTLCFFQVIYGDDFWVKDHKVCVLDVDISCSWSAVTQVQHLKRILHLQSDFMLHALWNQIRQSCSAQALAVPRRLVTPHCANVESPFFAHMTQMCGFIGILQKTLQKIQ